MRLLVVEDDPKIASFIRRGLMQEHYAVDTAADGEEGAAMAQVCYEHDVPCAIVRTVSDTADDHATASFANFLTEIAGAYSSGVLAHFLREYALAERAGA